MNLASAKLAAKQPERSVHHRRRHRLLVVSPMPVALVLQAGTLLPAYSLVSAVPQIERPRMVEVTD